MYLNVYSIPPFKFSEEDNETSEVYIPVLRDPWTIDLTRHEETNKPGQSLLSDPSSFMQPPMMLRVDTLGSLATSGVKTSPDSIFWGCGEAWDDPVISGLV